MLNIYIYNEYKLTYIQHIRNECDLKDLVPGEKKPRQHLCSWVLRTSFSGLCNCFVLCNSVLHLGILLLHYGPYYTGKKHSASHYEFAQSSFQVTICNLFCDSLPLPEITNTSYHSFRNKVGYYLLKLKTVSPPCMCCIFICEQRKWSFSDLFQVWSELNWIFSLQKHGLLTCLGNPVKSTPQCSSAQSIPL